MEVVKSCPAVKQNVVLLYSEMVCPVKEETTDLCYIESGDECTQECGVFGG